MATRSLTLPDYYGTIVVMDSGLSVAQWKNLETRYLSGDLDILGVLAPDASGSATLYTDPNSVTDADLKYKRGQNHGFQVRVP